MYLTITEVLGKKSGWCYAATKERHSVVKLFDEPNLNRTGLNQTAQ